MASATPLHWDSTALLAAASAIAVESINLSMAWRRDVGLGEFGQVVRKHWGQLLGLALLAGAAGIAVTGLVVALGVTEPGWLDTPLGWLMLGTAGPAIGAATITQVPVGETKLNVGLSLIYVPLRQLLLTPVDNAVFAVSRPKQRAKEGVYRQLVTRAFDQGEADTPRICR